MSGEAGDVSFPGEGGRQRRGEHRVGTKRRAAVARRTQGGNKRRADSRPARASSLSGPDPRLQSGASYQQAVGPCLPPRLYAPSSHRGQRAVSVGKSATREVSSADALQAKAKSRAEQRRRGEARVWETLARGPFTVRRGP